MVLNNHIFDWTEAIDMNEQLDGFKLEYFRTTGKRTLSTPTTMDDDGDTHTTSNTSNNDTNNDTNNDETTRRSTRQRTSPVE